MLTKDNKAIIYAQDSFGGSSAKTAIGFIKYGLCETVAVIDRKLAGKPSCEILGFPSSVPIVSSIEEAKKKFPFADVLLIGIAPAGGRFPEKWIPDMKKALDLKLNIVNGLHDFASDIAGLKTEAEKNKLFIWDVRKTEKKFKIASARLLDFSNTVVLTVGTDAAIGKMTVSLELAKWANKTGRTAKFVATGQTGMMISGSGVPIDAITGDFMAGAIEEEIVRSITSKSDIIFVEGQGSIMHPGWSGVTLALLHGALPHKLVLCHKAGREFLKETKIKIESLNQFIKIYEYMSLPLRKAKVVAIALNTYLMPESKSIDLIKKAEDETGLPADDVVRFSSEKLLKACQI